MVTKIGVGHLRTFEVAHYWIGEN